MLDFIFKAIAILFVADIFEFTKALASTLQGDTLPKQNGELTLNPFKHFEPIGFILLFFLNCGWGNPVRTSQVNYKNKRKGNFITYSAPIIACIILAYVFKILCNVVISLAVTSEGVMMQLLVNAAGLMTWFIFYFWVFAIVNLIPVYPMCGSKLLRCFLSPNAQVKFLQNEKLYQTIFVFALFLGLSAPLYSLVTKLM